MIRSKYTREDIIHHELSGANSTIDKVLGKSDFSQIPEHILRRATQRGADVHDAIENWILNGVELNETHPDLEYEIYYSAFKEWEYLYKPKYLSAELPFVHYDRQYKGIIDCVCEIDGKIVVIDWKTSSSLNKFRALLQQSLYTLALKEVFGIEVDEVRVLSITRKGYTYHKCNYTDDIPLALLRLRDASEEL